MPKRKMVDFDINKNLENLDPLQRLDIKEAIIKTHGKMFPCSKSIEYLTQLFKENVEPNFKISCGRCKRRVINFWKQRLENWQMY